MQETLFDVHRPVRSPLRYPGGKTRVAKRFAPFFPEHTDYREVFAGGAAIFFYKRKAETNWINDLHPGLYAFWRAVRDHFDEFAELCRAEDTPGSQQRFNHWAFDRRGLMTCRGDDHLLERAIQFYYLNRTVWGGRVVFDPDRKSRLYFSNPEGWTRIEKKLAHLRKVSAKLQGVEITCRDYAECIEGATADTFIYADPPYYRESTGHATDKLYDKSFDVECHHRLAEVLHDCPANVMVSYDDCDAVRELYPDWRHEPLQWKYSGTYAVSNEDKANGRKEKKVTGQELLILNYEM